MTKPAPFDPQEIGFALLDKAIHTADQAGEDIVGVRVTVITRSGIRYTEIECEDPALFGGEGL